MSSRRRAALSFALLISCARSGPPAPVEPAPTPTPTPTPTPAAVPQPRVEASPPAPVAPASTPPAPVVPGSTPPPAKASAEKTLGTVEVVREGPPRLLHAVRAATAAGYDRVVFEFRDAVPGYHLQYVDHPVVDCGAGDVKPVEGDGWLEVRFFPANAHTEAGQPTVAERELHPRLPVVREVERTCDFEAVVTWVVGTASPNRYRAFELGDPPRLVVDIDHDSAR